MGVLELRFVFWVVFISVFCGDFVGGVCLIHGLSLFSSWGFLICCFWGCCSSLVVIYMNWGLFDMLISDCDLWRFMLFCDWFLSIWTL